MGLYDLELCTFCGAARHKHRNRPHAFVAWAPDKTLAYAEPWPMAYWEAAMKEAVEEVKLRRREIPNWENEGGSCGDPEGTDDVTRSTRHLTTRPRG